MEISEESHQHLDHKASSPLFLGFDLSTQQLKVIALHSVPQKNKTNQDGVTSVLETHSSFAVHFDSDLPQYKTCGGVTSFEHLNDNRNRDDVRTTPVLLWIEALQLVLDKMKDQGFPFERVQAISGAAQQHGSVYWAKKEAQNAFQTMQSMKCDNQSMSSSSYSLVDIFKNAFAVAESPIWQDTSTTRQCEEIEEYLGSLVAQSQGKNSYSSSTSLRRLGQQRLAELTGSRAYERYTGNQISKIIQKKPDIYNATERISLVSSFLASLLMAQYAMIDMADGSGMNLLNIETKTWDPLLTKFVGRGGHKNGDEKDKALSLVEKLGEVDATGRKIQGTLSKWYVERYGFRNDVNIVTFTGDNPATVMAMHAEQGDAIVSLGTSDTLLLYTDSRGADARLSIGYLCHPVDPNGYLMLYCAKNGSLAREKVRDMYANGDWDQFNRYLTKQEDQEDTKRNIGFYFFDREIWPPVQGLYRFQEGVLVQEFDFKNSDSNTNQQQQQQANVMAICESQFLSMRTRSSQIGSSTIRTLAPPGISRILATGGASSNPAILQLLSNVFGVPVMRTNQNEQKGAGSAAWGAARKAYLYGQRSSSAIYESGDKNMQNNGSSGVDIANEKSTIEPDLDQTRKYVELIPEFIRLECTLLQRYSKQ
ncbi:hypothetical protein BCR41DRAFT_335445 [Lobosporangium transversale]|uniref:Xylulose kinase n=1 Tax=Lobosporangium transversale TaxID=64571 RepID=A0A1Y2GQW8_9FUNG|nr:hypothetical protein BCR41DRAFT_335445 [Lobosporangium transversale]ORZ19279.1 hypothetical protein BCR41DRAFT_335445 [Lobosporangium transversale]|eukprot:XP_021882447.1 hypothetical protein BCR41DRAFT_335445 [Lobosporangium transversale]